MNFCLCFLCTVLWATSAEDEALFMAGTGTAGGETIPYRLLTPATTEPGKRFPLVLFLHGAGERGDDNEKQLAYLPDLMSQSPLREKFPCFLLAPQCPEKRSWKGAPLDAAIAALEQVVCDYPIDLDRIYLTGLSMGGYGSWELGSSHADWFAAVVPICGGGEEKRVHLLLDVPLWVFHGAADPVVPAEKSRALVEALRKLGGEPRYDELEGIGHDSWIPAYQEDRALGWLFEQKRDARRSGGLIALNGLGSPLKGGQKIVFLGDSITQAAVSPGGYIQILDAAISDERATLIGAGISGHKVPDLQKRLETDVLAHDPDLVFIYIGINDVWHSQSGNGTSKEDYESGLRDLISRIEARGAKVILATPTLIGEQRENELDTMLEEYAAISRRVAKETGVHLCDLRTASRSYVRIHNPKDVAKGILTTDGVHLNATGNHFLADQAAFAIFELLSKSD